MFHHPSSRSQCIPLLCVSHKQKRRSELFAFSGIHTHTDTYSYFSYCPSKLNLEEKPFSSQRLLLYIPAQVLQAIFADAVFSPFFGLKQIQKYTSRDILRDKDFLKISILVDSESLIR